MAILGNMIGFTPRHTIQRIAVFWTHVEGMDLTPRHIEVLEVAHVFLNHVQEPSIPRSLYSCFFLCI